MENCWILVLLAIAIRHAIILWQQDALIKTFTTALVLQIGLSAAFWCAMTVRGLSFVRPTEYKNIDRASFVLFTISLILALLFGSSGPPRFPANLPSPRVQSPVVLLNSPDLPQPPTSPRPTPSLTAFQPFVEDGETTPPSTGTPASPEDLHELKEEEPRLECVPGGESPQSQRRLSEVFDKPPAKGMLDLGIGSKRLVVDENTSTQESANLNASNAGFKNFQFRWNASHARWSKGQTAESNASRQSPPDCPAEAHYQSRTLRPTTSSACTPTSPCHPTAAQKGSSARSPQTPDGSTQASRSGAKHVTFNSALQIFSPSPSESPTEPDVDDLSSTGATMESSSPDRSCASSSMISESSTAGMSQISPVGELASSPSLNARYLADMQKLDEIECLLQSYVSEFRIVRDDPSITNEDRICKFELGLRNIHNGICGDFASFNLERCHVEVSIRWSIVHQGLQDLIHSVQGALSDASTAIATTPNASEEDVLMADTSEAQASTGDTFTSKASNAQGSNEDRSNPDSFAANRVYGRYPNVFEAAVKLVPTLNGIARRTRSLIQLEDLHGLKRNKWHWEEQAAAICMLICWTSDFVDTLSEQLCIDVVERLLPETSSQALPVLREIHVMLKHLSRSQSMNAKISVPLIEAAPYLRNIIAVIQCLEDTIDEYAGYQASYVRMEQYLLRRLNGQVDVPKKSKVNSVEETD